MKEVNFRIIELPTHQVLLTKDFDDDEYSGPILVITFFLDGVKIVHKPSYSDEEKRDKVFNEFTEGQAQKAVDTAMEMLNQQP